MGGHSLFATLPMRLCQDECRLLSIKLHGLRRDASSKVGGPEERERTVEGANVILVEGT